jgi:CoA-transferase family III
VLHRDRADGTQVHRQGGGRQRRLPHTVDQPFDIDIGNREIPCGTGFACIQRTVNPIRQPNTTDDDGQRAGVSEHVGLVGYEDERNRVIASKFLTDEGGTNEVVVGLRGEPAVPNAMSLGPAGHTAWVSWQHLAPAWPPADVDADALWIGSGAQALTAPSVATPAAVVRQVAGMVRQFDARGAGLAHLVGHQGLGLLTERATMLGLPRSGLVSCGGAAHLLRAADGWVAASLARSDDFRSLPAWLGVDPSVDPWALVESAVRERTVADVVETAGLLGLACSAVGEMTDRRAVLVDKIGPAQPTLLRGLVVANLASLWAGPLAADILARLGAEVITVESSSRPDGARATPAFYDRLHDRSTTITLPLASAAGQAQLAELLQRVDVVIEGSRPRALAQMGIDARAVVESGPRLWVSLQSHGRSQEFAHRIGYGDDAAAAGGLVGWQSGEPRFLADAIADPLAGMSAAAAIVQLIEQGGRWLVDVSLARVAASLADCGGT